MVRFLSLTYAAVALFALRGHFVSGHPGESEFAERPSGAELARREHLASKRHLAARSCAPSINAFHAARRTKRALPVQVPLGGTAASQDAIHSYTCVTAPEIEEGPYYVNNELVRQDLVEDQKGVPVRLDIGVVDSATCEPVSNAFIEIWSCNATGFYGAFESNVLDLPPPPPPGSPDDPTPNPTSIPRPPRGPGGPPRGGGPPMSSRNTWLRGGFATDADGTVELTTLYPGFYPGRTVHVHLMVHLGWEASANGSIISHAGSVAHVGQLFFAEDWNDRVLAVSPYADNVGRRTRNAQDHDYALATIDGSSAIVQLEMLGDALDDGLLGFITIAIDTTADYTIHSNNYYNTSSPDSGSDSEVVDVNLQ